MSEILNDFLIESTQGFYCPYGDFYIDPKQPVACAVISHAHGDHAVPGHQEIWATAGTVSFMKHRFTKQKENSYRVKAYRTSFLLNNVTITFIPAGHILGSAQILMEYKGVKYLYTGDYKLQQDATCEPLEFVEADVVITETTFANPEVIHPDPIEEIKKLSSTNHNIMLGCYTLGKAQRITHLLNEHCPEKVIYVHHNIAPVHRIYENEGYIPLRYEIYNRKALKDGENKIYLVPPIVFNNYFRAKNVVRVFASGWKRLQHHNDMSLYISDHIDWDDLLIYIDEVKPKQVWMVHGDGSLLRDHLQEKLLIRNILKS